MIMNNEITDVAAGSVLPAPGSALPGESERAFEAFRVYLELGPQRRYAAVARKVGVVQRTIRRWAHDFHWRGRIKACAAQGAAHYAEAEMAVRQEELLDCAARAKAFRDRQYAVAEAILDAAENYLENIDEDDRDLMSFADACKALEVASRIGQQVAAQEAAATPAPTQSLRDQLTSLLDQVYADTPAPNVAGNPTLPAVP